VTDSRIITIFRSRLRDEYADEYSLTADRMVALAESMPGFIDRKSFSAADGERVTVVTFADAASHQAWRDHPEHQAAQRAGIDRFYSDYSIQVGVETYSHIWSKPII
jgi:hypothetical protein